MYPLVAAVIQAARYVGESLDCEVKACMCGDFVHPSVLAAFDGGLSNIEAIQEAGFDFVCLGDREFDVGFHLDRKALTTKLETFSGQVLACNVMNQELSAISKPYVIVEIDSHHRAVLCGVTTDDASQYPHGSMPQLRPIFSSIQSVWDDARAVIGEESNDILIPLTHQPIAADAILVDRIAADENLTGRVPIILGGHDRVVRVDETSAGGATIVKAGSNGCDVAIIDIWWSTKDELAHRRVSILPVFDFEPDPSMTAFCAAKIDFLYSMMATPVSVLDGLSNQDDRITSTKHHHPHDVLSQVLLMAKRATKKHSVDLALISAAAIRPGAFSLLKIGEPLLVHDLFDGLVHDSPMCIINFPGSVIADAVRSSRFDASIAFGEHQSNADKYLHCDASVELSSSHDILAIDGEPFIARQNYIVLLDRALLLDADHSGRLHAAGAHPSLHPRRAARLRGSISGPTPPIELLHTYVEENQLSVPSLELTTPIKSLIVEFCMRDTWRRVVGFGKWDDHHDLPHDVFLAVIHQTFEHMDENKDGAITIADLLSTFDLVAKSIPSAPLVAKLIASLDRSATGRVDREKLVLVAF
uniref:EF-hand domain-containing protein n=1 Tax=Aureoumbra lagunensis TaxID=44058 RepID=A0A7S3JTA4_9STRA